MKSDSNSQTLVPSGDDEPQPGHGTRLNVTKDEILEVVNMHKRFCMPSVAPGVEVTDLPNLDDITPYEVSEEIQERLWASEVIRLRDVVTSITPLEFKGSEALAVDSKRSYEMLADMADHIWQAVNIAIYDGESILALHIKDLCKVDFLKSSRVVLDYLCDKEEEDDTVDDSGETKLRCSREDSFDFVNYCTAVLARVLCAAADGKSFHLHILANLAKISAKVKIVSTRLQECAQISIDNGVPDRNMRAPKEYDVRGRQGANQMMDKGFACIDLDLDIEPLVEGMRNLRGELAPLEPSSKKDSMRSVYFLQCAKYRLNIFNLLRCILVPLRGTNKLMTKSVTSYELCSMVYGTGFEHFRTLVFQDNENDFLGTSDTEMVNCARSSFDLLNQTVNYVQASVSTRNQPPGTTPSGSSGMVNQPESIVSDDSNQSVVTRVSWSYAPDGRNSENAQTCDPLILKSMSHAITVMIPLIMTSPTIVCSVSEFITTAIFTELQNEREKNPIKPREVGKYMAFFCLTTAEYDVEQRNRGPGEPRSLSKALMQRNNLFAGRQLADIGRETSFPLDAAKATSQMSDDDQTTPERIQRHQLELDNFSNTMKPWVLEEKGVMVHCRLYVSLLMLLCAVLVAGGVSIGVAVGERITGVDPFNITTYCWVLAAFVLLVAKSVRVQNWPWNDFLHGRVLCKSVSELSSVTGVDEQLILAKLLQDESISVLQTRGPYNTVFNRKSEDSFSIDRPLSTWTMLLSGLIMIEVDTVRGRGLVCLDLRRGTKYGLVQNMGAYEIEGNEFIRCSRLPNEKDKEAHGDPNRIRLDKGNLIWLRALGFYGNKHAKFI
ncbi:hypothetical protein NCS57_00179400 [Fusarium keratoplasticum]|uniref:Uncharacterized protein n=1 Tax=Fusarium keratoplasticum TaxID=1328300 RepID=A0ACC0RGB9_9HYPO|nr:hypothetical protein NCS57_00179400 [Fusarium keratoplasticum]KAI8685112.1 hypothetical protein NCS57_00179400 [Fusarium keratoplasticum]KAI8689231.1 hypothetical protein NCS55_00179700 [Fusarium keratoplasticum]